MLVVMRRAGRLALGLFMAVALLLPLAAMAADPKPPRLKVVFDDVTYDFELQRLLGEALSGGADINEVLAAAHQIKAGDGDSWYAQWFGLGQRILKTAEDSLKRGHRVSAREALLRASNYFRTADFFLHANPQDPRILRSWRLSRDCFRRAVALMDRPAQVIAIPYETTTLPGYFLRPDQSTKPRKTVILMTGFDGTGEELYFETAFWALERGYNVVIFEGPGQGGVIREQKIPFRPDWENVVRPVMDWVLARPEVDPKRVALFGFSMGGYLAPRAAAFEHRLAALVANPGAFDMFGDNSISDKQWAEMIKYPDETNQDLRKKMQADTGFRWLINNGMFTTRTKTPLEFFLAWRSFTMKGLTHKIKCPTLVVASHGDHFYSFKAQKKLYDLLTCPKTLLVFTQQEHATEHCQMGALAISNQRILDWLDQTLAKVK